MVYHGIKIKEDTYRLLHLARQEFLRHHKELHGQRISNNHLLHQVLKFYLEA